MELGPLRRPTGNLSGEGAAGRDALSASSGEWKEEEDLAGKAIPAGWEGEEAVTDCLTKNERFITDWCIE
jgi:hypothetical protein